MACADEVVKEVPVEKIVTQEVVREVPVEKIVDAQMDARVTHHQGIDLEIPPGTQAGSEFRVRYRGVPRIRRDGRPTDRRGDIRVLVDVDIPSKLNKYQRKLVEDLAYSLANNGKRPPAPQRKKRSGSRKSSNSDAAEPEEAAADTTTEAQEPLPDDKQRGLFDRIKDTLNPNGE